MIASADPTPSPHFGIFDLAHMNYSPSLSTSSSLPVAAGAKAKAKSNAKAKSKTKAKAIARPRPVHALLSTVTELTETIPPHYSSKDKVRERVKKRKHVESSVETAHAMEDVEGPTKVRKGYCTHGKQKARCRECGGSALCMHGKEKARCRECGGSAFCMHGKRKRCCREC